jgi:hypothetical protein
MKNNFSKCVEIITANKLTHPVVQVCRNSHIFLNFVIDS